jgi:hypothetical protein
MQMVEEGWKSKDEITKSYSPDESFTFKVGGQDYLHILKISSSMRLEMVVQST